MIFQFNLMIFSSKIRMCFIYFVMWFFDSLRIFIYVRLKNICVGLPWMFGIGIYVDSFPTTCIRTCILLHSTTSLFIDHSVPPIEYVCSKCKRCWFEASTSPYKIWYGEKNNHLKEPIKTCAVVSEIQNVVTGTTFRRNAWDRKWFMWMVVSVLKFLFFVHNV